jgi:chaperonin cofactor prefoldin
MESLLLAIRLIGSPHLEALSIRINTLEQQNLAQERQLARLAAVDLFLSQMDTRLARFEERQNNVLKTLDDNAKRLDAINEGLQSHIRQWPGGANDK